MTSPMSLSFSRILLLIAVIAPLLGACDGPSWKEVQSPEGGFRILMRGDPLVEKQDLETPIGKIAGQWYSTELQDSVFGVGYADYPAELVRNVPHRELFTTVRSSWLSRIDGKLQGDGTAIGLEGNPGMEYIAAGKFNGRDAYLRGRIYLVGNRLFQVVVFGDKHTLPLSDINKFVDSFKLTRSHSVNTLNIDVGKDKKPPPWDKQLPPSQPPSK